MHTVFSEATIEFETVKVKCQETKMPHSPVWTSYQTEYTKQWMTDYTKYINRLTKETCQGPFSASLE